MKGWRARGAVQVVSCDDPPLSVATTADSLRRFVSDPLQSVKEYLVSCLAIKKSMQLYLLQLRHFLAIRQLLIVLLFDASASIGTVGGGRRVQVILVAAAADAEPA